jgi:hypothetical protein
LIAKTFYCRRHHRVLLLLLRRKLFGVGERKNYNSVIFLTTLSVYLGLVLVGAPSQVSAQGILERKSEVNYSDGEKILADYVSAFQELFVLSENLSTEFSEELKNGKYEFSCYYNINPDLSQSLGCPADGKDSGIDSGKFNPALEKLNKIFPHTIEKDKQQVQINLVLSKKEFAFKVALNQDFNGQAEQFFNIYNDSLSRIKVQQVSNPQVIIYQNTEISKQNNQIFIVTRLPRGSLDALLTQSAK